MLMCFWVPKPTDFTYRLPRASQTPKLRNIYLKSYKGSYYNLRYIPYFPYSTLLDPFKEPFKEDLGIYSLIKVPAPQKKHRTMMIMMMIPTTMIPTMIPTMMMAIDSDDDNDDDNGNDNGDDTNDQR